MPPHLATDTDTDGTIHTRTRRDLEFNLGTFNVPTIAGLLAIFLLVWNGSNSRATMDAQTQLRLDSIERDRTSARQNYESRMRDIEAVTSSIPNVVYRVAVVEQGVAATNGRLDRLSDSVGGVRESVSDVGAKIQILTDRLEGILPLRKTELLQEAPPRELR